MASLLKLPSELRDLIWHHAFSNVLVTPWDTPDSYRERCRPCSGFQHRPKAWQRTFTPLLTCQQIHREAKHVLYSTMNLSLSTSQQAIQIVQTRPQLLSRVRKATVYLHLDEDNRFNWMLALADLLDSLPNLSELIIHNHMRPPINYENMVDGIFFAAPLVTNDRAPSRTFHFDYIFEDVMFASPFLGEIKCSDALQEHEMVLRDLLIDRDFARAAEERDIEAMTGALLSVARLYEQRWFARLQRKRLAELAQQSAGGESGGA